MATDADACYRTAAFALHHPARMARGQWVALLEQWPGRQGRHPNYHSANHAAQAVDRHGATLDDIAGAWGIERDSARKLVADGRKGFSWQRVSRPQVLVASGVEAAALLNTPPDGIAQLPDDPERSEAWNDTLLPSSYDELKARDVLDRATAASRPKPPGCEGCP